MAGSGSWYISSASDPRWKAQGRSAQLSIWYKPKEIEECVAALTTQYGEPPDDLEFGFTKD